MAIEVFNRYENKYILDLSTFENVCIRISDYMEPDKYNKSNKVYTITNLYYDTEDSHLIRTSLSKPRYKEKLRIRAYGVPCSSSEVYLEIKKKFSGLVNKRRSAITLEEAYKFLMTGTVPEIKPYMNAQVIGEVKYFIEQHKLYPALYLAYDRYAYFGIGQHDLRVSFDKNIRSRRDDMRLESGDQGTYLIGQDKCIMEIKSSQSMPIWLCRILSEYKIYPVSFSKYGTEYKQMLMNKNTCQIFDFIPERKYTDVSSMANALSAG